MFGMYYTCNVSQVFHYEKHVDSPTAFVCWYIPLNNYYFRNECNYMNITCSVLEIGAFAFKLLVTALHQLAHRVFSLNYTSYYKVFCSYMSK